MKHLAQIEANHNVNIMMDANDLSLTISVGEHTLLTNERTFVLAENWSTCTALFRLGLTIPLDLHALLFCIMSEMHDMFSLVM